MAASISRPNPRLWAGTGALSLCPFSGLQQNTLPEPPPPAAPRLLTDAISPLRVQTLPWCHLTQKERWRLAVTQKVLPGPAQWIPRPIPYFRLPPTVHANYTGCRHSDTPDTPAPARLSHFLHLPPGPLLSARSRPQRPLLRETLSSTSS